jgi:putative hydrolase of the HAD superfamily
MIKAVLFDLDDTLYDETEFAKGGFKAVSTYISQEYAINEKLFFEKLMVILQEEGRGKIFDIALESFGVSKKSLIRVLVQKYRTHSPSLSPYPDALETLKSLKETCKLGLITDGNQRVQRSKIRALGIQNLFDTVITTTSYGKQQQKPSPFPYQKALSKLAVNSSQAVYVGDNPNKDFVGARKIGIYTIRVLRGHYKNVRLTKNLEADSEITALTELNRVVCSLNIQ